MDYLCVPACYQFYVNQNKLTLKPNCRLFSLVDINNAKHLFNYVNKAHVSTILFDISQVKKIDTNTESFLYQIAQYFSADTEKSLKILCDADSNVQSVLTMNLYKLNNQIEFNFLLLKD